MNKVKIFADYGDPQQLEDDINKYLAENPKITVLNIFATESPETDNFGGQKTIYLFYVTI